MLDFETFQNLINEYDLSSEDGQKAMLNALADASLDIEGMKRMIYSFADAVAIAIGYTTPYNANHAATVTLNVDKTAKLINQLNADGKCPVSFTSDELEQLHLAAALHDIGKLVTPIDVMNKRSRLDGYMSAIIDRITIVDQRVVIDELTGFITKEESQKTRHFIRNALEFIKAHDTVAPLVDGDENVIQEIFEFEYRSVDNKKYILINERERDCLLIKTGTLTDAEREAMKEHVVMTGEILSKVFLPEVYSRVKEIASMHHEFLDGTGYPKGLKGSEISIEARILAIADVYDALTAADRPYKAPITRMEAMQILYKMGYEGKLDKVLIKFFEEATR